MKMPAAIKFLAIVAALALGCTLARSVTPPANNPPQFDADISTQTIPAGKTLVVPVVASDPQNDPISYSVTSDNKNIMLRVKTGHPDLNMHVSYAGDPGSTSSGAQPFDGDLSFQLFRDLTPTTSSII